MIIIIVLLTGITSLLVQSDRYTLSAKYKVTANVYERRVNLKRHVSLMCRKLMTNKNLQYKKTNKQNN